MSKIHFEAKPYKIGSWTVLLLPRDASAKLPSRGQVMVKGTINGFPFQTALEPDGRGSHWLHVDKALQQRAHIQTDKTATFEIESSKDWPEPDIPADVQRGIVSSADTRALWQRITPLARWEWLRWIGSTNNAETRKRRIEVSRDKLLRGERRPCCFNRNVCCVPDVSKNGVLLDPAH